VRNAIGVVGRVGRGVVLSALRHDERRGRITEREEWREGISFLAFAFPSIANKNKSS